MIAPLPPTIGRTVLFCRGLNASGVIVRAGEPAERLVYRPAIVVAVLKIGNVQVVNLQVLNDCHTGFYGDGCPAIAYERAVPFSIHPESRSWCWPTHVLPEFLDGQSFPIADAKRAPATDVNRPHRHDAPGNGESSHPSDDVIHTDTAAS